MFLKIQILINNFNMKNFMEPKININGTCYLEELYINAREVMHYIVLSAEFEPDEKTKYAPRKINIKIPIKEKNYQALKEKISWSKAQQPYLKVKGSLELILDAVCLN
jgi:hypothetical protein